MKINSKTRRQFLLGSAKTFLALPILPSLFPRAAWGQTVTPQKRFIAAWLPLGGYSEADIHPNYLESMTPMQLYADHKIHHTDQPACLVPSIRLCFKLLTVSPDISTYKFKANLNYRF